MNKRATQNTPVKNGHTDNTASGIITHEPPAKPPAVKMKKKPPNKIERALILLLEANQSGVNWIEAFNHYGEGCFHSCISSLRHLHGVAIAGETECHITRVGTKSYFKRYSLVDPKARTYALNLINKWRTSRGADPLSIKVTGT